VPWGQAGVLGAGTGTFAGGTGGTGGATSSSNGALLEPCKGLKGKGKGKSEFPPEKIFVARLPKTAVEATVRAHFEQFGPVSKVELKMGEDGMARGFGFVTFLSKDSAARVVQNYEQNRFEGRWIACEACVPQDGTHKEAPKPVDPLTAPERIFVGGLPRDATEEKLRAHFSEYGRVVDVDLKYDHDGAFRGFGFITFEDKAAAEFLVDHHGHSMFEGKAIHCKRAQKFDRVSRAELEAELEAELNKEATTTTTEGKGGGTASGALPSGVANMLCPGMGMNMGMLNMMAGGMAGCMGAGMGNGMGGGLGAGVGCGLGNGMGANMCAGLGGGMGLGPGMGMGMGVGMGAGLGAMGGGMCPGMGNMMGNCMTNAITDSMGSGMGASAGGNPMASMMGAGGMGSIMAGMMGGAGMGMMGGMKGR